MTVASEISKIAYAAGGGNPPYAVPFLYLDAAHVEVVHRSAEGPRRSGGKRRTTR